MKILNIGNSHEAIKRIKELKKKNIVSMNLIEDISILEFLKEDHKKLELFIYCPEMINNKNTNKIKDYFVSNSKEVFEVSSKVYSGLVDKENRAGLIGIYQEKTLTKEDLENKDYKFVVVADRLETPGNLGTLFRTCDGCKVDLLIIVDEIVKHNSTKVIQSSRGMSLFVDKIVMSYQEAQEYLLKQNFNIYLGEPILGKDYQAYDYRDKIAIVIGNERYGINPKWYDNKHLKVFIPMSGRMTSLNVSIAGSILIYEAFMKRNKA